jgi:hypothetical protein
MTLSRVVVFPEIDAPDEKLLLLVEIERQVDDLGVIVHIHLRRGGEIDEPVVSIKLGVVLDRFADFSTLKMSPFLIGKMIPDSFTLE